MFSFAASCRKLAGILAALVLIATLLPVHANARNDGFDGGQTVLKSLMAGADESPAVPDEIPGQLTCHCVCSMSALPALEPQPVLRLIEPVQFIPARPPSLICGAQAPPVEPPRT